MKSLINIKKNLVGVITADFIDNYSVDRLQYERKSRGSRRHYNSNGIECVKATKLKGVKPITVTLRHINVRDTQRKTLAMLQDVVDKTLKAVPGLKIEMDGVEDTVNRDTKLKAEMAAGKPAEYIQFIWWRRYKKLC